ncbi:CD276 antigen-like isoform X1 [Arapaima gigas]
MNLLLLLFPSLLTLQVSASSAILEVKVPDLPVVALFGQDAILNCSFSPISPFNMSALSLFWQLTDTKRSVHSFWAGRDQLAEQAEGFVNRTSLFHSQLSSGNTSLLLRNVQISDDGSFTCFVSMNSYNSASMLLQVAASYSKPAVTMEPNSNLRPGDHVSLSCTAYGGFPMAEVLWQDGSGHNLTDNVTSSQVANEEGLFSLRSVLKVVVEPNSTYVCRVKNPVLGEDSHASVTITGQGILPMVYFQDVFPTVALWVTVGLAVCLLALLVALAVVCRRKIKESCEEAKAAEEGKLEEDDSKTAPGKPTRGFLISRGVSVCALQELRLIAPAAAPTTPHPSDLVCQGKSGNPEERTLTGANESLFSSLCGSFMLRFYDTSEELKGLGCGDVGFVLSAMML